MKYTFLKGMSLFRRVCYLGVGHSVYFSVLGQVFVKHFPSEVGICLFPDAGFLWERSVAQRLWFTGPLLPSPSIWVVSSWWYREMTVRWVTLGFRCQGCKVSSQHHRWLRWLWARHLAVSASYFCPPNTGALFSEVLQTFQKCEITGLFGYFLNTNQQILF